METREIYKRVLKFVSLALNDQTIKVIIAEQNAPFPTKPFVTVRLMSTQNIHHVENFKPQTDNSEKKLYFKNATVRLQCYSDDIFKSFEILEKVKPAFDTDIKYAAFENKMGYVRDNFQVTNVSTQLDTETEYRAAYEFILCYSSEYITQGYSINHIDIHDEVSGDDILIDI